MTKEQRKDAMIELTKGLSLDDLKEVIEILAEIYQFETIVPDHNS